VRVLRTAISTAAYGVDATVDSQNWKNFMLMSVKFMWGKRDWEHCVSHASGKDAT
jgi:hypothetical protein